MVLVLDQLLGAVPVMLCHSFRAALRFPHLIGEFPDPLLSVVSVLVVLLIRFVWFVGHSRLFRSI